MELNKVKSFSGLYGKNYSSSSAATIELRKHINGSGPKYMNGSTMWPNMVINIAFLEDADPKSIDALEKDIENVLIKHGYKNN